jgi:hypothetical protein
MPSSVRSFLFVFFEVYTTGVWTKFAAAGGLAAVSGFDTKKCPLAKCRG